MRDSACNARWYGIRSTVVRNPYHGRTKSVHTRRKSVRPVVRNPFDQEVRNQFAHYRDYYRDYRQRFPEKLKLLAPSLRSGVGSLLFRLDGVIVDGDWYTHVTVDYTVQLLANCQRLGLQADHADDQQLR